MEETALAFDTIVESAEKSRYNSGYSGIVYAILAVAYAIIYFAKVHAKYTLGK